MIILDASILLDAYNADFPRHEAAPRWLAGLLAGPEWIGLPWLTIWAFLRISTNPKLFPRALEAGEAFAIVRAWLGSPRITVVDPGPRHLDLLEQLAKDCQAAGPLLTDAALAALGQEYGARLASTDRDFARFHKLDWVNPLDAGAGASGT